MDLPTTSCPALELILEWLSDDKANGVEWDGYTFGHYVAKAVKLTGDSPNWTRAIVECEPGWRAAYEDRPGRIAGFGPQLLDGGHDPRFEGAADLMTEAGF